ncbi:MAPEG family protein [Snodgrassella sp. B3882]|uniref:MAPEG family protein n=1 Tax=Snodgrassella sp. B3882 TaxID=2818037 RepID=UPI00226A4634|nr:MAPEG family protein [Snodgrassella sp. B3882]MCX8745809.1 MAPEG family protein [Snodgrassella sp. B3882]
MTLAYWCVVIAMFLPWIAAFMAKKYAGFSAKDNHHPRAFLAHTVGKAARANAAQQNGYEVFAPFAAAVMIAHLTGNAAQITINSWSVLFILSRIGYLYCYIQDKSFARSCIWIGGIFCILALYIAAI